VEVRDALEQALAAATKEFARRCASERARSSSLIYAERSSGASRCRHANGSTRVARRFRRIAMRVLPRKRACMRRSLAEAPGRSPRGSAKTRAPFCLSKARGSGPLGYLAQMERGARVIADTLIVTC